VEGNLRVGSLEPLCGHGTFPGRVPVLPGVPRVRGVGGIAEFFPGRAAGSGPTAWAGAWGGLCPTELWGGGAPSSTPSFAGSGGRGGPPCCQRAISGWVFSQTPHFSPLPCQQPFPQNDFPAEGPGEGPGRGSLGWAPVRWAGGSPAVVGALSPERGADLCRFETGTFPSRDLPWPNYGNFLISW